EEGHELRVEGRRIVGEGGHRREEPVVVVHRDHGADRLHDTSSREALQRGGHRVDQLVHPEDGPHVGFGQQAERCRHGLEFYRMIRVKTIDAHAAGEPLRLIVDGFPAPQGRTMLEKREWARRKADPLRRALMLEPRGHADMYGALLTEPVSPGSHAGVLFMHNEGYSTMCGHGIIAVTTIALERGLLMPGGDGVSV